MNDRNFIVNNVEKFFEHNANISPENSLPLPRYRQKNEINSLSYDVNDCVYSKSQNPCNFVWI